MERIALIKNQLLSSKGTKIPKFVDSAYDYFNFDEFLSEKEQNLRKKIRNFLEKEIRHQIKPFIEKAEFPFELLKKFTEAFPGLYGGHFKGYGSIECSFLFGQILTLELGRVDASFMTFATVHRELAIQTIYMLGSDAQKQKWLPSMIKGEKIGSWALTEPDNGSDASSIQATAEETKDGYVLNGSKRWIGNATWSDLIIIWARNTKTKEIQAFIVEKGTKGLSTKKIEGKFSLRPVQNADITLNNVFVSKEHKLEKANSFKDTNLLLLNSRLGVAWAAVGIAVGAYDATIQYVSKRKQFGKTVSKYQLTQEKLSRMMGHVSAMLYLCKRATELLEQNKLTIGRAGLCKAWCSARLREVVALGREMLGGNGILIENHLIVALLDAESIFTYEGTYDVNMLVAGRELTGLSAFK